ncbi:unnamed protein product, partial [Ectocarpus sp. 13 AM-2016]
LRLPQPLPVFHHEGRCIRDRDKGSPRDSGRKVAAEGTSLRARKKVCEKSEVGMDTEGQGSTSATPTSATATEPKEEEVKAAVVSGEVCESIKKGMRIISDIEKTRADGMVFKFELDLMYALAGEKATARAPPGLCLANCQRAACNKTEEPTGRPFCCCSKCG